MHTRTIAALLMSLIEEVMVNTPPDTPMIIGSEPDEFADITSLSGVQFPGGLENQSSFNLETSNGARFRIDVVRIG